VHCHAGCEQGAVIDALRGKGLWENDSNPRINAMRGAAAERFDDATIITPIPDNAPPQPTAHPVLGEPTAAWRYLDGEGRLSFEVWRFDTQQGKEFRPLSYSMTGWKWRAIPEPRPLYGLDKLAANPSWPVVITEGEKAADAASQIFPNSVCITSPGGADAAKKANWAPLKGRRVLIWPDADEAGANYAQEVAGILRGLDCKNISIVAFESKTGGWDAADAVEETVDLAELRREVVHHAKSHQSRLRPLTAAEFLTLELPPRQSILGSWLPEKGLIMVYSPRGVGKTMFGMTCGYAIAAGAGFLDFTTLKPRKVLYLDAEMPAAAMQERLAAIVQAFKEQPPADDFFRILNGDLTEFGLPDLATAEGQNEIDAEVGDSEIIFVDNVSTMVRSGKENEAESWLPIQNWALRHRRAGRAVVLLHHAGKGGAQRGTSRREDVLDSVISLRHPADYTADQGCRFEAHFEKARGFHGNDAQSFEAKYEVRAGVGIWTRRTLVDAERARVVAAIKDGMSIREAAEELGFHRSKVERLRKKAIEEGELSATVGMGAEI
jgi:hypothetical protein